MLQCSIQSEYKGRAGGESSKIGYGTLVEDHFWKKRNAQTQDGDSKIRQPAAL
jgi:hypothetical protein